MRTETPQIVRLEDYRPSDFLIDRVELDIRLHPTETRILATLAVRPNPKGRKDAALELDGDELRLVALSIDGRAASEADYAATPQSLRIPRPPARPFTLTIETAVNPSANTKLMGLYRSGGVYCTQCEAEGFRRITYFLDRPDVLAVYTTRLEGDRDTEPLLLGNGNPVEAAGVAGTNRHYAVWHDPFPKPSYLFAIVGGALGKVAQTFTTMHGRAVEIAVHVKPGKENRAGYALDALERAMRWDEEVFGREYDLDVFNVVAVSDFNMGAMENKGLNIFNDKYVLASPETATDMDYAAIEAIIAHEYFHNWSGNRVTCRDWFQLCLKEGLTVFRDQEFSSDMRSRPVHRIAEVKALRARQFPEDAGPLAHPVRPPHYREINNFYTATVYEKGAEIVRMLKTLIGDDAFRRGMDRYFARCDGTAATVEDFLAAFAHAAGKDLSHFARWYAQAGTPRVAVTGHYDAAKRTYRLDFAQATPATPGQAEKAPIAMPVVLGLSRRTARRCRRVATASPARACSCSTAPPTASRSMTCRRVRCRRCSAASRLRSRSRSIFRTTTSSPCCGTTAIRSIAGKRRRRSRCASWCGLGGREATSMTRQGGLPVRWRHLPTARRSPIRLSRRLCSRCRAKPRSRRRSARTWTRRRCSRHARRRAGRWAAS